MTNQPGQMYAPNWGRYGRFARVLALLLGGLLFLLVGLLGALPHRSLRQVFSPIVATDLSQPRYSAITLIPNGALTLQQTFTPRHDGLRELEIRFARAEDSSNSAGQIHLRLSDASGQTVSQAWLANATIAHNQTHVLQFAPQPHSAGQVYTLSLRGTEGNEVALWGYSLDVYAGGELSLRYEAEEGTTAVAPLTDVAELAFTTRYQLTWRSALAYLGKVVVQEGGFLLLTLAFLLLPGALLLQFWPLRAGGMVWLGMALALGTAVWPLVWQFSTLLGWRWRAWSLWLLLVLGWLAVLGVLIRRLAIRDGRLTHPRENWGFRVWHFAALIALLRRSCLPRFSPVEVALLATLLLGLAARLLAVRDLAVLPWVDASRHALITAVMRNSGQVIRDYGAYLPVDRFPYHYGLHTLTASLALLTQRPLPDLLLTFAQLLNALLPLTVYAAVQLVARRPLAALLAAFLVALPFLFPAYYATWGRLTQLAAMLVMPLTLALTWLLLRGGQRWRRAWGLLALLTAGLFLLHFRVFTYYLPFVPLVWLLSVGRNGRYLLLAAFAGLLLVAPHLLYLRAVSDPLSAFDSSGSSYNAFPSGYLTAGWERAFILAAALCLLPLLWGALRRRRWPLLPLTLAAWVSVLFLLLAGERLGLPETWLFNLNSMYITLFLPQAILLGLMGERFWRWLVGWRWWLQLPVSALTGALLLALLLFGVRNQITVLNPQTILVQPSDLAGIAWVEANLPPGALLAVNSWRWLGNAWAAQDGGAWLTPLTGRQATTPPVDYVYSAALAARVQTFNETAVAVSDWRDPAQIAWLREQRVSHIFVGARGGFFDPAALARNPAVALLYAHDGVFVFALKDG